MSFTNYIQSIKIVSCFCYIKFKGNAFHTLHYEMIIDAGKSNKPNTVKRILIHTFFTQTFGWINGSSCR